MDSASSVNSNGLLFVFDQLTYQGHLVEELDSVVETLFSGKIPTIDTGGAGRRTLHMPLTLDLIEVR
jgi:hypothetical protein